jgi:hypothetical protein
MDYVHDAPGVVKKNANFAPGFSDREPVHYFTSRPEEHTTPQALFLEPKSTSVSSSNHCFKDLCHCLRFMPEGVPVLGPSVYTVTQHKRKLLNLFTSCSGESW